MSSKKIKTKTKSKSKSKSKSKKESSTVQQTNKQNVNVTVQLQHPHRRRPRSNAIVDATKYLPQPSTQIIYRNIYQPPTLSENKPVTNSAYIDTQEPKIANSNVLGQAAPTAPILTSMNTQTDPLPILTSSETQTTAPILTSKDTQTNPMSDIYDDVENINDDESLYTKGPPSSTQASEPNIPEVPQTPVTKGFINKLVKQVNDIEQAKNIVKEYGQTTLEGASVTNIYKLAQLMDIPITDINKKKIAKQKLVTQMKESVAVHAMPLQQVMAVPQSDSNFAFADNTARGTLLQNKK